MQPSNTRLLTAIRDTLTNLAPRLGEEEQAALGNVQLALTELLWRADHEFCSRQLERGRELLADGAALLDRALETPDSIEATTEALAAVTDSLAGNRSDASRAFLDAVVDWENSVHRRRQQLPGPVEAGAAFSVSEEALLHYLQRSRPELGVTRVANVTTLKGGFSKMTILFDAINEGGRSESLVFRSEQELSLLFLPGSDVANEFQLLQLAFEAGIPVAEPLWLETDRGLTGGRFIASRRGRGHNIGSRVDIRSSVTDEMLRDFIRRLVQIHRVQIKADDPRVAHSHLASVASLPTRQQAMQQIMAMWRRGIEGLRLPPSPITARALGWLEANVPADDRPPVLLHGDYGLHNILVEGDRVSCILDWESSNMGHPAEDLAWLLDGLGAQIERQRVIDLYEAEGGEHLDPFTLTYFEVMNALKFAVTCPTALSLFEQHDSTGIEALQLGFYFTLFGTGRLNETIARAEALRSAGTIAAHG